MSITEVRCYICHQPVPSAQWGRRATLWRHMNAHHREYARGVQKMLWHATEKCTAYTLLDQTRKTTFISNEDLWD